MNRWSAAAATRTARPGEDARVADAGTDQADQRQQPVGVSKMSFEFDSSLFGRYSFEMLIRGLDLNSEWRSGWRS